MKRWCRCGEFDRTHLTSILAACCLTQFSLAVSADELDRRTTFDIPAQSLDAALVAFSEQSGVQIVARGEVVSGLDNRAVSGDHTGRQALSVLLQGSDLTFTLVGADTVAVSKQEEGEDLGKYQPASNQVLMAQAQMPAQSERASSQTSADSNASGLGVLEEVVVTATRRSTRLQDTPVAISTASMETLDNNDIRSVEDLSSIVPGLNIGVALGNTQMSLRGVSNDSFFLAGAPTVAFHVDGIYRGRQTGGTALFHDLERVEVLKGPQGTLYGNDIHGGNRECHYR